MHKWKRAVSVCMAALLTAGILPYTNGSIVSKAAGTNLVQNGGFENGDLTGWSENDWCKGGGAVSAVVKSDGTINPADGTYFLKQEGKNNGAQILQGIQLQAGTTYWLTAQIYQEKANSLSVGFMENEGKNGDPKFQTKDELITGQWEEKAIRFTMWQDAEKPQLFTWLNAGTKGYVDSIQIVESADYSQLEASVKDAENKVSMTEYYTEDSIKKLETELEKAQSMTDIYNPDNVDHTQDEINAMNETLQQKIGELEILPGIEEIEGITAYYIDAENGNDANAGTSPDEAWRTFKNVSRLRLKEGGKLLLKAGCVWNGEQLSIQEAHGSTDVPVVIGRYGEGEDPVINGNGNPWQTNVNAPKEDVAAVHIYNSSYVTVENLAVTNWEYDETDLLKEGAKKDQSKYLLTGILVENHDAGDLDGIVIQNNHVYNVNGRMEPGGKKGTGGIIALVTGNETKSSFANLTIQGNEVNNICHQGIYMESSWASRKLVGSQQAGSGNWTGWKNVYVANNYVHEIAGDGIVLINVDGGVAEKNLITETANEDWNYSRNPAHAAIWMWDCNNVTMQYNEAAYTQSYQDGMAFDFDYGNQNVMYQYNYSHDNKGGFWMSCPGPNYTVNAVARYNVSVNDGLFDGARILRIGERGSIGNQFYNNTMYWDHGYKINAVEQATWGTPPSSGTDVYNNIFYGDSDTFVNNDGVNYKNNCVFGGVEDVYPVDEDPAAVIADPKFSDTHYTAGNFNNGTVTLGDASGFALQSDSPCIDSGADYMEVPQESLPAVADELVPTHITIENKDYAGNTAPYENGQSNAYVDIGAYEYQGESTAVKPETDKTYLNALIRMAEGYQKESYTEKSYENLKRVLDTVKGEMNRPALTQEVLDAYTAQVETAIKNLVNVKYENTAETAENILAVYGAEQGKDNAGFEADSSDWGAWQSEVSLDADKAKTGSKSLKVKKTTTGTAYSEIGNVPVKANTEYVLEAWLKCEDTDVANVSMEAKHHNSVTGSGDIKLGNAVPDVNTDADGWKKVRLTFTTQGYESISISVNSNLSAVWLDDAVLYQRYTVPAIDTTVIDQALSLQPEHEESWYSQDSWAAYEEAVLKARLERINAEATEQSMQVAADDVQKALKALVQKEDETVTPPVDPEPETPSEQPGKQEESTSDGQNQKVQAVKTEKANTKAAKTGDASQTGMLMIVILLSSGTVAAVGLARRKRKIER